MKVADLMTKEVKTLDLNDTLDVVDDLLETERIRHIPVLERGLVVGVVSQRDLFRSALSLALGYGEHAQKELMKTLYVKAVMSDPAITVGPEDSVQEAAQIMLEKKIGCLPVVQGERLLGILTESDLLRVLAENLEVGA